VLPRLAISAGLGGAIGFERELRERRAGLRTHLVVCVGSALFTLVSAYGFEDFFTAHGTTAPAIVAGVAEIDGVLEVRWTE
jgi:putative Mg2+ transporter-C (MgtC) family protein